MQVAKWGVNKIPPRRAKMKEIEGQAILTSELLTMERQTESPINPKKKKKKGRGEKGENQNTTNHGLYRH